MFFFRFSSIENCCDNQNGLNRLKPHAEIIADEQAGFRAGRSTTGQIFNLRILREKYLQHKQDLYYVFIDFKKAFDRVWHAASWATMKKYNISLNLIRVIKNLSYKDHVTNEEVRAEIQLAIGPHEDLLTIVKRRKLQVVWSCLPFIRSGQNHLARHSERVQKTRQAEEEVGRQHQGMDKPEVRQVPEGSGEQGKMEKTGCKVICGAPTTLAVKGLMMMMMMIS